MECTIFLNGNVSFKPTKQRINYLWIATAAIRTCFCSILYLQTVIIIKIYKLSSGFVFSPRKIIFCNTTITQSPTKLNNCHWETSNLAAILIKNNCHQSHRSTNHDKRWCRDLMQNIDIVFAYWSFIKINSIQPWSPFFIKRNFISQCNNSKDA